MTERKAATRKRRPTHPGAMIARNLEALEMTAYAAAPLLGVSRMALGNIIAEKSAVSPEMAWRLGRFFDTGPDIWINLQKDVDLWDAREKLGAELTKVKKVWDASNIPIED